MGKDLSEKIRRMGKNKQRSTEELVEKREERIVQDKPVREIDDELRERGYDV
ncbi:MAG: hypothetical protein WC749_16780 [Dehalococcoidia bacterium]